MKYDARKPLARVVHRAVVAPAGKSHLCGLPCYAFGCGKGGVLAPISPRYDVVTAVDVLGEEIERAMGAQFTWDAFGSGDPIAACWRAWWERWGSKR